MCNKEKARNEVKKEVRERSKVCRGLKIRIIEELDIITDLIREKKEQKQTA